MSGKLKKIIIKYSPHAGQKLVHYSPARIRLVFCHIRWGKTLMTAQELIKRGGILLGERLGLLQTGKLMYHLVPLVNIWNIAPSYKLLEQSIAEMKHFLPSELGWKFNESKNDFHIWPYRTTDHRQEWHWKMSYRSGDDPERLVAEGVDMFAIEEARAVKKTVYELCRGRLSDPGRAGLQLIIGTPGSQHDPQDPAQTHWQFKKYMQALNPDIPEMEAWKFSCYSPYKNPGLTEAMIDEAKRDLDPDTFKRDYEAEFLRFEEGTPVVPEYVSDVHYQPCRSYFNPGIKLYHCWDLGWGHVVLTVHQITDDGVWVQLFERMGEDIALPLFAREALGSALALFGNAKELEVWPDDSGRQHKATDGRTEIEVLKQVYAEKGLYPYINTTTNTEVNIERGIDVQRMRCKGRTEDGRPLRLVDRSCPITDEALSGGWRRDLMKCFKSGQPKPKKDGYFDHFGDSCNMFAMSNAIDVMARPTGLDEIFAERDEEGRIVDPDLARMHPAGVVGDAHERFFGN